MMIPSAVRLGVIASAIFPGLLGAQSAAPPRASINSGTIEGVVDSATGVMVFRGVPYASPPVGALRWQPPQPPKHWAGVRQASRLGHNCIQHQPYGDIDPFAAGVSEDCLYLNVMTNSLDTRASKRPVMVWIHGGGFWAGFGGEERHNGARLAQKGAVVVTLNYRLGPFGFLAHPALAAESPHRAAGNYGLLDQIAALQWVQRNIARFGGDPTRVTIFGESAGGMSVGSLIASPLAKGLFQRAILESGTGLVGVAQRDTGRAIALRFAESVGVPGQGADAAKRLRALHADTLLAASSTGAAARGPSFFPVVDGWVLPVAVDSALLLGKANLVPVIAGTTRDEGDEWMGAPTRSFARLISARGGVPTYVYLFSRVGDDSANRARGAYHSAEITFVFGRPRPLQPSAGSTAYDSTVAEAMSDYWVAFASSGDPNGAPAAGKWPRWPRYNPATDALLEIGPEIAPRTMVKRAVYDSLDAIARSRGGIRPR